MGVTEYPDEKQNAARAWLEKGRDWLKENADHPKAGEIFDQWLEVLHKYKETYGMEGDDADDRDEMAQARMSEYDGVAKRTCPKEVPKVRAERMAQASTVAPMLLNVVMAKVPLDVPDLVFQSTMRCRP